MLERKLPAYPLFVKDPYFSLWATEDDLTNGNVKSWWGEEKPIYGFIKTEKETYCFLGDYKDVECCGVKRAIPLSVEVTAFTTDYTFAIGEKSFKVSFVSPLLLTDTELTSMPVCYMNFEAENEKNAEVSLFINRRICYNDIPSTQNKEVRGGAILQNGYETAFFGLKRQMYLSNNEDGMGSDWGYYYVAGEEAYLTDEKGMMGYLVKGDKSFGYGGEEKFIVACGKGAGRLAIAYDDIAAIDYFGHFSKTLYLENHTIFDALSCVMNEGDIIDKKLADFDDDLRTHSKRINDCYYEIVTASLRQSIAAHKIVRDENGAILFLSKENNSNGCIATVDVSYPSIPLYLLYNTELVKGMMRPILKFAKMPVWQYDFAPHDAGTYPACCGQIYGLNYKKNRHRGNLIKSWDVPETHFPIYQLPGSIEMYDINEQMPVEECADMLIMFAACYHYDGDISFFNEHKDLCEQWVKYLVQYGVEPENQLCTDDFAGRLKNNLNLSIKAIVGIGAYAQLCNAVGSGELSREYDNIAKEYADKVIYFACKFKHLPLTWDSGEDTFSLKYNLAFDVILGLNLFPQSMYENEIECYLSKNNEYGVPLDNRKNYTKADWLCWIAALTSDSAKREKILMPLVKFLRESPTRLPFSDWFETESGEKYRFQARSVVGGCFMPMLMALTKK